MQNNERKEIIERLESRKIRFSFQKCKLFRFLKGRRDSKKGKVDEEVKKFHATLQKFVEEEYKNLVKETLEPIINIETAESKIKAAKELLEFVSEPKAIDDPRKQKREIARVRASNTAIKAKYKETTEALSEDKAFVDTALNIVSRLCLSAYQYTISSINDYLKYVTIPYTYSPEDITYDKIYSDFYNRLKIFKEETE